MSEQYTEEDAARIVERGVSEANYVHSIRLHTDETGMVDEVPLIDGVPFPGIESVAIFATADRPTLAIVKMRAEVDVDAYAVIAEHSDEEPPPQAA